MGNFYFDASPLLFPYAAMHEVVPKVVAMAVRMEWLITAICHLPSVRLLFIPLVDEVHHRLHHHILLFGDVLMLERAAYDLH